MGASVDDRGNLLAPVAIETQGVFIPDDSRQIFKELYAASERAIQELAGSRVNIDALKKAVKARVRDILRKRDSSFAVILPVISVKQSGYYDDYSKYEKDFF